MKILHAVILSALVAPTVSFGSTNSDSVFSNEIDNETFVIPKRHAPKCEQSLGKAKDLMLLFPTSDDSIISVPAMPLLCGLAVRETTERVVMTSQPEGWAVTYYLKGDPVVIGLEQIDDPDSDTPQVFIHNFNGVGVDLTNYVMQKQLYTALTIAYEDMLNDK